MTLHEILSFVNFVANKEQSGLTMSPEQYNTLLIGFNTQVFAIELETLEVQAKAQQLPLYRLLYGASSLRPFRKNDTMTTNGSGIAALPSDYVHYTHFSSLYNGMYRDIDVISDEEMSNRRTSLMETPLEIKPACTLYGNSAQFYPKDVGRTPQGDVEITYIASPATPNYDYCLSEYTGKIYYMPPGYYIRRMAPTQYSLYDDTNTLVVASIYHRNGSTIPVFGTLNSTTVELEWDNRFHPLFITMLLNAVGVSLKDEQIRSYLNQAKQ